VAEHDWMSCPDVYAPPPAQTADDPAATPLIACMQRSYAVRADVWRALLQRVIAPLAGFLVPSVVGVVVSGPEDQFGRTFLYAGISAIGVFVVVVQLAAVAHEPPELAIGAPGIELGGAKVPWPSIWQVVVICSPAPDSRWLEVGLRLRFGAPLPEGLTSVVYDPGRPQAFAVRQRLPARRVDPAEAGTAVRAFAPPDVEAVTETDAPSPTPRTSAGRRQDAPATVTGVRFGEGTVPAWAEVPSLRGGREYRRLKPHPVVRFTLPDGRVVVAAVAKPAAGQPGARVVVSYDVDDPDRRAPAWRRTQSGLAPRG